MPPGQWGRVDAASPLDGTVLDGTENLADAAIADLATSSVDLAGSTTDLAAAAVDLVRSAVDLASPPDLASAIAPPSVLGLEPTGGPAGTVLTVSGSGFQAGDTVILSGSGLGPTALGTLALSATAILAIVPSLPIALPADLSVQVQRAAFATPTPGLAFRLTAGQVYYLSPSGSDGAAGTKSAPWRTVSAAATRMKPGDLAYLRGGTYSGQAEIRISGTASSPITFTSYPGESALLVEPATSPGSDLDTVRIYGAYVVLDRLRVSDQNNPGQAIWIAGTAHHVTIRESEVFDARGQGILITGNNNLIYRNRIHDNGVHTPYDHGIYVEGGGNVIRSNLVYNNWTYGIHLYNGSGGQVGGNVVEYNYVFHNGFGSTAGDSGAPNAGLVIAAGHPSTKVRYNRFCGNAQYGIYLIDGQSNSQLTDNITCYNGRGGLYMRYPGSGNSLNKTISYNDSAFALSSTSGVTSDYNTYFVAGGAPSLLWKGQRFDLAGFRAASGQDAHSQVTDPKFTKVPTDGFDPSVAESYDFCNAIDSAFCAPAP